MAPRRSRSFVALALLVTSAACSSAPTTPDAPTPAPARRAAEAGAPDGDHGEKRSEQRRERAEPRGDAGDGTAAGTSGPGTQPDRPIRNDARKPAPGAGIRRPERAFSLTQGDYLGDTEGEGDVPRYADVKRVRLRVHGRALETTLTFGAALPRRMADDGSAFVVTVELQRRKGDVSIYAELTDGGWRGRTNEGGDVPLQVNASTLAMVVPTSFSGKRFGWYASASWTRSSLLETEYSFDFAPDDQKGRFPRRG